MREARLRDRLRQHGILRSGTPRRGFRYRHADGRRVARADRARIDGLKVPPAWREVAIAPSAGERVQAVGLDAAGRWQYWYTDAHTERRSKQKFARLLAFGAALPGLRGTLRKDLARPGLPIEKTQACAVLLMSACAMRPGAEEYARDNGTFGLATLRERHVTIRGDRLSLNFRGKHGVVQNYELTSRLLARLLRTMKKLPGHELLKYQDDDGGTCDLRRHHVNAYVKSVMGRAFSARDFRTWAGTLWCAARLRDEALSGEPSQAAVRRAFQATAEHLGNTPAVVRDSYVHPGVVAAFRKGRVVSHGAGTPEGLMVHRSGLDRAERALLRLLRTWANGRTVRRPGRRS
jgi:DNA topoisomerase-1